MIYLGSNGAILRIGSSRASPRAAVWKNRCETTWSTWTRRLDPLSCSARFYTRVAFAFDALASLPHTREASIGTVLAPQDAVKAFRK